MLKLKRFSGLDKYFFPEHTCPNKMGMWHELKTNPTYPDMYFLIKTSRPGAKCRILKIKKEGK